MKNILFIHQHYYPEMAGTARRTKEVAEALAKNIHLTIIPSSRRDLPLLVLNFSSIAGNPYDLKSFLYVTLT